MATLFPMILLAATLITGLISLVDIIFWSKKRKRLVMESGQESKRPIIVDYSRSFFVVFLVVLIIRSFVAQAYRVPTGSLEPTVVPGDLLLVNQFEYGLRLPVSRIKILNISEPKVGDIVVLHWPVNPKIDYIKRVVGVPGDHISYINKVLYINAKPAKQKFVAYATDSDSSNGPRWKVKKVQEDLVGVIHGIYLIPNQPAQNFYNYVVPKGEYFVMGDNRDASDDSRYWGLVPEKAIVGKAEIILLSWNPKNYHIRWHRIGKHV